MTRVFAGRLAWNFLGRLRTLPGFTLLEALVAIAVFALLITVLLGMVDSVTKLWRASENRAESYREARAALSLMASDLKAAVPSTNTNYFSTNVAPSFSASTGDGSIFFVAALPSTAQSEDASRGDLCQVGYYLKYGNNGMGGAQSNSYSLYRYFKESNGALTDLAKNADFFQYSSTNVEVLAQNVAFFKVRPYTTRPNGMVMPWVRSDSTPIPTFLELEVTAFNSDAVKRLKDSSEWKNTNSRVFRENSRSFVVRVSLRPAS